MQPPEPHKGPNIGTICRLLDRPPLGDASAATSREATKTDPAEVILVGASVRSAAASAKIAGYRVLGIDQFGDTDTRVLCDQFATFDELLDLSLNEFDDWASRFRDAIVLQVGGMTGRGQRILSRLSGVCQRLGPTDAQSRALADPLWLDRFARGSGIHFPTTVSTRPTTDDGITDAAAPRDGTADGTAATSIRWLHKRSPQLTPSSGGLGVRFADNQCEPIPNHPVDEHCNEIWQKWVPGRSFGATFYSDGDSACFVGLCRSSFHRIKDRPFVYAGSSGPLSLPPRIVDRLNQLGNTIVRLSQLSGLFGTDIIIDRQERISLIEINPRWTASCELIERAIMQQSQTSAGHALISVVLRRTNTGEVRNAIRHSPDQSRSMLWKRVIYARNDAIFRSQWIGEILSGVEADITIADIPNDGHVIRKHEPVFTLMGSYDRDSADAASLSLRSGIETIRRVHATIQRFRLPATS
tara:strand:- start:27960 stop:29369 length:1410 start_codon:yes stop_codon:yes gene_type:complete